MQEVSDLRRDAQYHARRGMKAIAQGRFQVAVGELEQATAANPERTDVRYNLAAAQLRLGRRKEARSTLVELVTRAPEYALGRILLARMLMDEEDLEAAEGHLREALAQDPDSERVHLALADLELHRGRLDEALLSYSRALELTPELVPARLGAAVVKIELGHEREALHQVEESIGLLPGSRELRLLLARLLAAAVEPGLRDGHRALDLARAAVSERETVAGFETLAMALAELGRFDEAIEAQRAALRGVEAPPEVQRAVERLALYERHKPCREPWIRGERLSGRRVTVVPGKESGRPSERLLESPTP